MLTVQYTGATLYDFSTLPLRLRDRVWIALCILFKQSFKVVGGGTMTYGDGNYTFRESVTRHNVTEVGAVN